MEATNKKVIKTLRLSHTEFSDLRDEAARAGLNFSDYVRHRLFNVEPEELPEHNASDRKFNCDYEREMMRIIVRAYGLIESIAHKALDSDVLSKQEEKAGKLLQKWGFEESNKESP